MVSQERRKRTAVLAKVSLIYCFLDYYCPINALLEIYLYCTFNYYSYVPTNDLMLNVKLYGFYEKTLMRIMELILS